VAGIIRAVDGGRGRVRVALVRAPRRCTTAAATSSGATATGTAANVTALKPQYVSAASRVPHHAPGASGRDGGVQGDRRPAERGRWRRRAHYKNDDWFGGVECQLGPAAGDGGAGSRLLVLRGAAAQVEDEFAAAEEDARRKRRAALDDGRDQDDAAPPARAPRPATIACTDACWGLGPIDVWNELLLQILAGRD